MARLFIDNVEKLLAALRDYQISVNLQTKKKNSVVIEICVFGCIVYLLFRLVSTLNLFHRVDYVIL